MSFSEVLIVECRFYFLPRLQLLSRDFGEENIPCALKTLS